MFLAPCGHEGIPVTVNYVTCPLCDGRKVEKQTPSYRTFCSVYVFQKGKISPIAVERNLIIPDTCLYLKVQFKAISSGVTEMYRWFDSSFKMTDVTCKIQSPVTVGQDFDLTLTVPI